MREETWKVKTHIENKLENGKYKNEKKKEDKRVIVLRS